MNNKFKILIIFSALLFGGLFLSTKSAHAQTYIDWFPTPTGLSGSCNAAGTSASMSWDAMPPYDNYFRVANDTTGGTYLTQFWHPDPVADSGPSASMTTTPGNSYTWWVHARDGWGNWGPAKYSSFTCPNPPPAPTCSSSTPDGDAVLNNSTVRFYANGVANATSVLFYTWSDVGGQDDIIARWGTQSGSTWYVDAPMSSHPGDGIVRTHVYMYPGGTWCDQSYVVQSAPPPPPLPTCSSATPDGDAVYNNTSPRIYANGVANATNVLFYTWSESGGQDDIIARWGTQSGSTWYVDPPLTSHPGNGNVITHVYMFNNDYGATWCDQAYVTQYSPLAATVSASPTSVAYGGSSTITWSSTSASTCAIGLQQGGPTPPGGTGGVSGSWTATNITTTTQYFISCNGVAGGNTGAYSQVITPAAPQQAAGVLESNSNSINNNNNCASLSGWAWDPDFPDTAIQIHIYHNGSFYTNISAGDFRGDLPGNKNHGFTYAIPSAWKDGASHTINMYAIDLNGNGNPNLIYSPVSALVCAPSSVDIKANGSDGPISINNNTSATLSWTSTNATSCSLYVNNLFTGWTGTAQPSVATGNMTSANTYRVDCTGNNGNSSDSVQININAVPTCVSATPDGEWTTATSGTRVTTANGVANATSVLFPTWSEPGGQDDIVWYTGVQSGSTFTANINLANHPGLGAIYVDVYLSNANYTNVFCDSAPFTRLNNGTINVDSNVPTTWTITCPLTNPNCPNITSGSGSSGSFPDKPTSTWTLTPANISGYDWRVNNCAVNTPCAANFGP